MKKKKYGLVLVIILILVALGIGIKSLIPKLENTGERNTSLDNLKDTNNDNKVQSGFIYEIKNIKAITSTNNYTAPTFSPDGKKLAFSNLNFKGIIVTNLNDGTQKILTDDDGAGFRYSWSPDSKGIVYLSRKNINGEQDNTIKLVEIETGKIIELTASGIGASMPSFTQTNEVIYSYKGTLIKRNWNDGSIGDEKIIAENVPANIIIPTPKGDKLIIEDDEGIKIMDSNGVNRKTIVLNGEKNFAVNAIVSFDSNKVLFFNNVGSIDHLFSYDIKTEKITDLGVGYFGQWLQDCRVIYCITEHDGYVITGSEIYLINEDGTGKVKMTDTPNQIETQLRVSLDGKSISYRDEKSGIVFIGKLNFIN